MALVGTDRVLRNIKHFTYFLQDIPNRVTCLWRLDIEGYISETPAKTELAERRKSLYADNIYSCYYHNLNNSFKSFTLRILKLIYLTRKYTEEENMNSIFLTGLIFSTL